MRFNFLKKKMMEKLDIFCRSATTENDSVSNRHFSISLTVKIVNYIYRSQIFVIFTLLSLKPKCEI